MTPITFQLQLSPSEIERFERAMRLTPGEIDAIAKATAEHLRRESVATSASMTVVEFAKQARVHHTQVYKLIKQGRLEATRPGGGDIRITAAAAAKYFAGEGNGHAAE